MQTACPGGMPLCAASCPTGLLRTAGAWAGGILGRRVGQQGCSGAAALHGRSAGSARCWRTGNLLLPKAKPLHYSSAGSAALLRHCHLMPALAGGSCRGRIAAHRQPREGESRLRRGAQ